MAADLAVPTPACVDVENVVGLSQENLAIPCVGILGTDSNAELHAADEILSWQQTCVSGTQ
eukprot:scaffold235986_cov52-Prasinocladus_malaysianus.AAC.1